MRKTSKLNEMKSGEMPRERLMRLGPRALSDAELIAILLRTGSQQNDVLELSNKLLASVDGSLDLLSRVPPMELCNNHNGIAEAKAVTLSAALELGHRLAVERIDRRKDTIEVSRDLYDIFLPVLGDLEHEEFWVVLLNSRRTVLHKYRVAMGGWAGVAVDVRPIFRTALMYNATMLAVAHNHPSGSPKPSRDDIDLTRRISEAGRTLGIKLLDHIIISATAVAEDEGQGIVRERPDPDKETDEDKKGRLATDDTAKNEVKHGVHYYSFSDSDMI